MEKRTAPSHLSAESHGVGELDDLQADHANKTNNSLRTCGTAVGSRN